MPTEEFPVLTLRPTVHPPESPESAGTVHLPEESHTLGATQSLTELHASRHLGPSQRYGAQSTSPFIGFLIV